MKEGWCVKSSVVAAETRVDRRPVNPTLSQNASPTQQFPLRWNHSSSWYPMIIASARTGCDWLGFTLESQERQTRRMSRSSWNLTVVLGDV